jgi:hypothetical protein
MSHHEKKAGQAEKKTTGASKTSKAGGAKKK